MTAAAKTGEPPRRRLTRNETPLVSIVLPTRNRSAMLVEAIDAVRAQTLEDWELVIVDDASEDETPDVVRRARVRDPRIRRIRNTRRRGLPRSLNRGFRLARGRFLTWTSDDNAYRATALERMVAALDADPSVGMVHAACTLDFEDGTQERHDPPDGVAAVFPWNEVRGCFLYRREVQRVVGPYSPHDELAEDYDYWLRIAARFPIQACHEDLYIHAFHRDSLTSRQAHRAVRAAYRVMFRNLLDLDALALRACLAQFRRMLWRSARRRDLRTFLLGVFNLGGGLIRRAWRRASRDLVDHR